LENEKNQVNSDSHGCIFWVLNWDFFYLCKKYEVIQQYNFETANPAYDNLLLSTTFIAAGGLPGFDQHWNL
jgi:hypothetical protein